MRPVEAFLEVLRGEGISRVFGNPGTTELPLIDALAEVDDLSYVLGLQEGSVVAMADGYARATARPSLVSLHVAAGLANGLVGMLNASRSRTPMVVVAGQQDRRHLTQDPMLSGDLVGLASSVAKSAVQVQHAYDLVPLLRRAFALAARPPAGPVFVSVPMDLLAEEAPVDVPARSPAPAAAAAVGIGPVATLLAGAARPAIVAGDGVGREGAVGPLVVVAERLGATVYHQPMNDGVNFPGGHPLYGGMLLPRNTAIRAALSGHDVILIVGCHAFAAHHYTPGPAVPDGAVVVQVDSDPAEIGRNFTVAAGLVGSVPDTLRLLAAGLDRRVPEAAARLVVARATASARRAEVDAEARARYGPAPLHPLAAVHAIAAGLPPDTVVVEEAITAGIELRKVFRPDRPGSYVHTVGGGLGWGIGAAVGTRMGRPDRPVVAVLGDGCAMFGIQGLWSAARYQVPVTFLVMNNGEYRTLKDTLDANRSRSTATGRYVGLDLAPPELDWSAAARLFGIAALRVERPTDLREAVAGAGRLDGPLLVEVPIQSHADQARRVDRPAAGRPPAEPAPVTV
jgi:benzoylformate decarboxylase